MLASLAAEIVETNREINAGLADPRMKARLADLGGTVLPGSPSDFAKLIVLASSPISRARAAFHNVR